MKIRIKILLGYVLLAGLVGLVGLIGYRSTHQVGENFDDAINRTQPVLNTLQDIRFQVVFLLAAAHQSVHEKADKDHPSDTPEPPASTRFAVLDAATTHYQGLVAAYFPGEVDEAAAIARKVAEFKAVVVRLDDGLTSGALSGAQAETILDGLAEATGNLLAATEDAAVGELKEFTAYQQGVKDQVEDQERMILAIGLLAFLAAIWGGAKISGRIARPVAALRDAARKFGGGHLDTRVSVADNTEVGELASAFNSMAEQLAGSMVSREYVEDIIDSMAEGMLVVDRDGRVERVNHAFRTLFRCEGDYSFKGQLVTEYLPDHTILDNALSSQVAHSWSETEMRTAGGDLLVVALSVASLHSNNAIIGAVVLVQDITERKRSEERLSYLARYDSLTGLPNRTLFLDLLAQALARQPWKKENTAVLFCDLDRFKFVNDTMGHGVGDLLLQRVAERLQACVRPGDVVARWSGDEFVLMFCDVAQANDVAPLAERVVAYLSEPIQIGPHELYVTASVGVSLAPQHATRADELVKCADMAMYAAKAEGKNTYRLYATGMAERSQERLVLERALRRALVEGDQLQVHYQAQQRLDGPLIGFEALVRWHHPELGLISPANFLPAAEEAGLMAAIDETVLRMACGQARQWQREGIAGLRIAVNISDHLFRRGDLPKLVSDVLAEYELPPSAIEVELTEAIVMTEVERSIRTMHDLREIGVELSIDDFGTGYSSLAQLKRCPIQMLKIDRSFVNDVMTDPNDAAITEAITAMAHKMGIQVIAEGVETVEQLAALRQYGCDAMQGYLLSKPIPAAMLPEFLTRVGHPRSKASSRTGQEDSVAAGG